MKPKRQEDSSCVVAYYYVAALADTAIPQEKKERIMYNKLRKLKIA